MRPMTSGCGQAPAPYNAQPRLRTLDQAVESKDMHSRFPPTRSSGIRVFSATSVRGNPSIPNLLLCASHDARSQRCHVNNCMHVLENLPD